MQRIKAGHYENSTYRIHRVEAREFSYNSSRMVASWTVLNKQTGKVTEGFATLSDAKAAAARNMQAA